MQSLAELLVARGNDAIVVTGQPRGAREIREVNGVRVIYTPVRNFYRPLTPESAAARAPLKAIWHLRDSYNTAMANDVAQLIEDEEPDVVNTHNLMGFSSSVIGGVRQAGVHVAHTIHDQYLLCPRSTMFKRGDNCAPQCRLCRMYALPRKYSTRHVGAVIGVSQFVLNRHIEFGYFPFATRHVIYNGITVDEQQILTARHEHRAFRFGFLGQIRPTKGLEQLIDAFSTIGANGIELHIAGRGDDEYEQRLRQKTADNPGVTWCGYVNAREFLNNIDVLVVPSLWHDTAPLVLMEAMREGTPVLGAIRGGIPEFVSDETGWLYDPSEPSALKRSLESCVSSRERFPLMRRAARAMAQEFDDRKFVNAYLNVYQELSSRKQKI